MTIHSIYIIVGALLLVFALKSLRRMLAFMKNGERAVGTVVELVEKNEDDGTFYYPVFNIPTRRHEVITYKHLTGSSTAKWQVGETAAFIFHPGRPETVWFLNYGTIFWWPLTLLAVAIDLLLIGGGYFVFHEYFGA
ncbi:hypothetical protein HF324_09020 [Chitinophaga oryzae]|uniref:DUF3592 domain-containing protein n=1 Tax=Chitinophaga oryzae TaxID=2725414 RepID=A0ABX6LDY5_9BACT|nr:DUF3592 domain-containing protein [Chitinophaga oryzae]QJB37983.1 hypothetical protein HF324_09020 [Chitinophaga oryzae]